MDVLVRNSKLSTLPKGEDAAGVFNGIKFILGSGDSPLTREEYVLVANQYGKGRDACRAVFESFTEAQQAEAAVEPVELTAEEVAVLRDFDLTQKFGPCIGITRKQRWQRADKGGREPPISVWRILERLDGDGSEANQSLFSKYGY